MELCLGPHRAATVVMTLLSFTAAASPLYRGSAQLPAPPPPPPHTHANGVPFLACLSNLCLIIMALKLSKNPTVAARKQVSSQNLWEIDRDGYNVGIEGL